MEMDAPGDAAMPKVAFRRLMSDLRSVRRAMEQGELPWVKTCEPVEDNMMNWMVELKFPEESLLQKTLDEFAASIFDEAKSALSIRVRFPPEYPLSPPEVWIQEPRLKYQSAPVTFGGKVCNLLLTSGGWQAATTPVVVLEQVRDALLAAGAEVDAVVAAKATYRPTAQVGINRLATTNFREAGHFHKRMLKAMSAMMAEAYVGDVSRLEASDKIMLPFKYAEEVYGSSNFEAKCFFELKSQVGRKTHCALMDFVHGLPPEFVLMPKWVIEDLFVDEGEAVTIRLVHLELCSFVKIQPHSVDFYEAVTRSGKDPKVLLRDSLRRLSALTLDTAVPIEIDDEIYEVQIVDLQPQAAVAIISTGEFEFEVDFDPAPDLEDEAARHVRESQLLARYKKSRSNHDLEKTGAEQRRAEAKRAHYDACLAAARAASAGAEAVGGEGAVEIMLRLPGGTNLPAHLPEGAACAGLVTLALESEWAQQAAPWDLQLLMAFPRRVLQPDEAVSRQMHRSVISVREISAPEDDEELFAAVEEILAQSKLPPATLDDGLDHCHDLPELDENALQLRTQGAFEVQRWINSGADPEEAIAKVEAGVLLPPTPEELAVIRQEQQRLEEQQRQEQQALLTRTLAEQRRQARVEAAERRMSGEPLPPEAGIKEDDDALAVEREMKIQSVMNFTCADYPEAFQHLENNNWDVDTAVNKLFDERLG